MITHEILDQWEDMERKLHQKIAYERTKLYRETLLKCENPNGYLSKGGCGNSHQIGTMTVIQTHWYETPHGCSGGDLYHAGELRAICPSCGKHLRLIETHEKFSFLKKYFKEVVDHYD